MEIPRSKAKAIYAHLKRIVENVRPDATDTRTYNALRLARKDLRTLETYITMDSTIFVNNELCDGKRCSKKSTCVRYMGNVDIDSDVINLYVIGNLIARPKGCAHYLKEDNGFYPQTKQYHGE